MERRNQHRASPDGEDLTAAVHLEGGAQTFHVMNITSGGAALMVPPEDDPGFECGQRLDVAFTCPILTGPLRAPAVVVHVQDEVLLRVCGMAFTFDAGEPRVLPADVRGLFNRRRNERVPSLDHVVVSVATPTGEPIATATLIDLSEAGLAFRTEHETVIAQGDALSLEFTLPTGQSPLKLSTVARYVEPVASGIQCGVEFDPASTSDFEEQRIVLVAYMVESLRATTT